MSEMGIWVQSTIILVFWAVMFMSLCVYVANEKGFNVGWAAFWGLVGGMIALIVYALLPSKERRLDGNERTVSQEKIHCISKDQRATNNKFILPMNTKIAVLLMTVFGIVGVDVFSGQGLITNMECGNPCRGATYVVIGLCSMYIVAPMLICIKNRIAWTFAIVILIGLFIYTTTETFLDIFPYGDYDDAFTLFLPVLLAIAIPLIILITDRKNYFEMTCQRKLTKDNVEPSA